MNFSTRIAAYFIALVVMTTGILFTVMWFEKQRLQKSMSEELDQQMRDGTAQILHPIYELCKVQHSQVIPLLEQDLKNARYLLSRIGKVTFSEDRVPWNTFSQAGNNNRLLELPMMLAGGEWIGLNTDPLTPSPVVDDIKNLSNVDCSIYQRVNEEGDMLRVCTSILNENGLRDIGVYAPYKDPSGAVNNLIASILNGETYVEQASAENNWLTKICEPVIDGNSGQVAGILSVEVAQREISDSIRKIILQTTVGKTGYLWVIGTKGDRRGKYIISKDGLRDGEDLWLHQDETGRYFIRSFVENALQTKDGAVKFDRYPWINPGEGKPRIKISAYTYYEPWDWVIGASAYEDDFKDAQERVDKTMSHMMYLTLAVSLAIIICSGFVGFFVMKTIDEFQRQSQMHARELERISRYKSEFLANMSHELRTPLNAILGFSELMTRDANLTARQTANLATIGRSGEHLLSLINGVLEFSKIEAGSMELHLRAFDLHKMILGVEEMFKLQAQEKGLTLQVECETGVPQYIRADENKLRQVLINLVGNSIKFTTQGKITLKATVRDQAIINGSPKNCLIHFEVEDTGIGIAPDKVDKIFEAFFQAEAGNGSFSGTGLGLSISQRFVHKMGGELTVTSQAGKGSLFQFDIMADLADASEEVSFKPGPRVIGLEPGQPVFRLLIVEDNEINRRMLFAILQPLGFDLREAVNGKEAVEIWEEWKPHLIWMDMRMPVMDGIEATRRIKENPEGVNTIIIALTASVFEEDRGKMISAGCDDFIRKPFKENELFEVMGNFLNLKYIVKDVDAPRAADNIHKPVDEDALSELAGLSIELRGQLRMAVAALDYRAATAVIDKIDDTNPALSKALTQAIEAYQFDKIIELLDAK